LLVFAICSATCLFGARSTTMLPGSVKNFELPHFDDKTGVKEWELFGASAVYISDRKIDIAKLKLDLFDKSSEGKPRAILTSPSAQVDPIDGIAKGSEDIFVTGDDFKLTGKSWQWQGRKKFMEIFKNVRIDFNNATKKQSATATGNYASLDHSKKSNVFSLKDNVNVLGEDIKLKCDVVVLKTGTSRTGNFESMRAKGNVFLSSDGKNATSQEAFVNPDFGILVFTGNPKIVDVKTKATLLGEVITLNKAKHSLLSESSADGKLRASTILLHNDDGKEQKITISSDTIKMLFLKEGQEEKFAFSGNVKIEAPDFTASCDSLVAIANSGESSKSRIRVISGAGNVKFRNDNGLACSDSFQIFPEKSEIWLKDNCILTDPKNSSRLQSDVLILIREQNKGLALSDAKKKDSRVRLFISDSPDTSAYTGANTKIENTVVSSRKLNFSRNGDDITFSFFDDVNIKSGTLNASCEQMNVFAGSDSNGKNYLKRVDAHRKVNVSQGDYIAKAELATIYPKLKSQDGKKLHKFVELSTASDNPSLRPQVILPPFGNLGLNDDTQAKLAVKTKTVITSSKQWLVSSDTADRYYFEGDVKIEGTDMHSECGKIEVVMKPQSKKSSAKRITQIIMTDSVKMVQGLKEATCGRAEFLPEEEMAILSEDPVVYNREDNTRASGYRMVYRKGRGGVSIEGEQSTVPSEDDEDTPKRPTLVLPSLERIRR